MPGPLSDYDIDPEALNVKNAMDSILAGVVSIYDSLNVPLPTRRYWTIGDAVWDCEQVVVSYVQTYLGNPGDEATLPVSCRGPKSLVVNISVVREIKGSNNKNGKPPSPENMQESAEWSVVDSWILMDNLETLSPWEGYAPTMIATTAVPPPSGGYNGIVLTLTTIVP